MGSAPWLYPGGSGIPSSQKGVPSGVGSLDGTGHQTLTEVPTSVETDSKAIAGGALKPPSGSTRTSTYGSPVLRDFISVADFGADRSGATASTTAIRNAIAEAQAITVTGFNSSKSATVYIPPGRYLIDGKIQIPEATAIRGAGYSQTSLLIPSGFVDNAVFEPLAVDGTQEFIGLEGFILYGASASGTVPTVSQANGGVATTVATSVTALNQYMSFSLVANGSLSAYASNGTLTVGASGIRVRYQSINTGTNTFNGCVVVNGLGTAINSGDSITPVTTNNIVGVSCMGLAGPTYLRDLWLSTFTGEPLLIGNCNSCEFENIVANYSNRDCILYTGARASNYFRAIAGQYSGVANTGTMTAGFHLQGQNGLSEFAGLTSLDGFYSEQTSDNAVGIWLDNFGSFSGQNINLQGGVPVNPGTQRTIYISATQSAATVLTQDGSHSANVSLRNIHCGATGRVLIEDTIRGYKSAANATAQGLSMTRYDTEDSSPSLERINVSAFGAVGNAQVVTDGVITSGTLNQLSSATANFKVGQTVSVLAAGPNVQPGAEGTSTPGLFTTTILSVAGTTATLAASASFAVSGATVRYGKDDTAAVQAAINAASALASPGESYTVVALQSGRAYMLGNLIAASNVMMWMYGATVYLTTSNAVSNNTSMLFGVTANANVTNWHLRGGTFPGTGTEAGVSGSQGIMYWHNAAFGGTGIATYTDISIKDAIVTNWATGVWDIRGGSRIRIEGNTCRSCSTFTGTNTINVIMGGGSSPVNSSDVFIMNNFIDNNGAECIAIGEATNPTGGFDRAIITGNNVQGVGGAACLDIEWSTVTTGYVKTVIVANNVIRQSGLGGSSWGIAATTASMPANADPDDQIIIKGNIINSTDGGIIVGASNAIVEGNVLNVQAINNQGIQAKAATTVTITADLSSSTTLNNVSVAGGGSATVTNGIQLDGNAGIQNGTYLVSGAGTSTWIISLPATTSVTGQTITGWVQLNRVNVMNNILQVGSTMVHNPIFASGLRDSRIHGNTIAVGPGSTATGQAAAGILLQRSGWCDIDSNRINFASVSGIQLDRVNDCHVMRNRIYNCGQAGIGNQSAGILCGNISGNPYRVEGNIIIDDQASHTMYQGVNASSTTSNGLTELIRNEIRGASNAPAAGAFATGSGNINDVTTDTTLVTATNASWKIPPGATLLRVTCVAGGGGGAGAGSSSAIANQTGGSGGTSGQFTTQVVSVGSNTTLNVTVGAGGTGGTGGALGGNAGADGTAGGPTTVTGTGISLRAEGGGRGLHSAANSSTTSNGLVWGSGGGATSSNAQAGGGGAANSTNGLPGGDSQGWVAAAGQGGAPTSATNGGVGGLSTGFGANTASTSAGTAPTATGTNGGAAPANSGGGGGGGGGGAWNSGPGSAGGNGGNGGSGFALIEVLA